MNNGVIILSYCEIDELHLLFLPLKPWLTWCSSVLCTADFCIPHALRASGSREPLSQAITEPTLPAVRWMPRVLAHVMASFQ